VSFTNQTLLSISLLVTLSACCSAQQTPAGSSPSPSNGENLLHSLHLTPTETISSTEVAVGFGAPFVCDDDGNIYISSGAMGVIGIHKLNAKGERTALFEPSAIGDPKVAAATYFSVTRDGDLYVLAFMNKEVARYVLVFKPDGSYKEKIKLDPGFPWVPASLAVFPNGTLLVTGQEYDIKRNAPMLPFTGIFRADGKLLKEVVFEDDDGIHDLAKSGDAQVYSPQAPNDNRAVSWGQIEAAKDGNLYIMRWLTPAIFYAVSPGGQVIRRFTVDPGNRNFRPLDMHISGNRMAVLFYEPQTNEKIMKIVDLEGHELATYDEPQADGKSTLGFLGLAFACYTQQPERFMFLTSNGQEHTLQFRFAEAR
jgi:hypothetical protein